jgi:plastocyanin
MTWRKREIMNEQERELDFMVAELEHENTLMRARNTRLEAEVTVLTEMVRVLSDRVAEMEAKQEQSVSVGEPVAWMSEDEHTVYTSKQVDGCFQHDHIPLYTTPQQRTWVGLTWNDVPDEWVGKVAFMEGAKWADKQLKEKNT